MGDWTKEELLRGFAAGLDEVPDGGFDGISEHDAFVAGYGAVRYAIAPLVWSRAVGDRLDTTDVTKLLGVSRQALSKRVASGSLIGLPGSKTTYYPTWQFDLGQGAVREEVRLLTSAFREELDHVDPWTIASWATTPQTDLDGLSAAQWIEKGGDPDELLRAAQRYAARLAE